MLAVTDGQLPHARGIPDAFVVAVLASLSIPSLFTELDIFLTHQLVKIMLFS